MDKVQIMQEKWDYLIILDACRYDYFEQLYGKYLTGSLAKRRSVGSNTKEWRDKSFTGYYADVAYLSGNPLINSVTRLDGFFGKEHFAEVYDLWRTDWDHDKGTVLPGTVTRRAREAITQNPRTRAIIHYMQPHEPYLGAALAQLTWHTPVPLATEILGTGALGLAKKHILDIPVRLLANAAKRARTIFGGHFSLWTVRKLLRMSPMSHMDAVRRAYGKEGLRRAYRENLQIVLEYVGTLVDALSGRIVITSDHGELLGEGGCYCHWARSSNPLLLDIPWLVIDKGNKPVADMLPERTAKPPTDGRGERGPDAASKRQIEEKLRALGYY